MGVHPLPMIVSDFLVLIMSQCYLQIHGQLARAEGSDSVKVGKGVVHETWGDSNLETLVINTKIRSTRLMLMIK